MTQPWLSYPIDTCVKISVTTEISCHVSCRVSGSLLLCRTEIAFDDSYSSTRLAPVKSLSYKWPERWGSAETLYGKALCLDTE